MDEEDDTVRFIHHSVSKHFDDGARRAKRDCLDVGHYFILGEADLQFGLVCATYLSYNIFNTALTTQSNLALDPDRITQQVMQVANNKKISSDASRIITALKRRRSVAPTTSGNVNIGQLLQRYMPPKSGATEWLALSDYAHEHWLWHTSRFHPELCGPTFGLFESLVKSPPDHIIVPWEATGGLKWESMQKWAIEREHLATLLVCPVTPVHYAVIPLQLAEFLNSIGWRWFDLSASELTASKELSTAKQWLRIQVPMHLRRTASTSTIR